VAAVICVLAGIYIGVGIYGVVLCVQGLQGIARRRLTVTYNTVRVTKSGISIQTESGIALDGSAVKWGIMRLICGLLASVPWLIPMIWDMPLTRLFWITPFGGLVLHIAIAHMYGFRVDKRVSESGVLE
jgi:hypothetical protein